MKQQRERKQKPIPSCPPSPTKSQRFSKIIKNRPQVTAQQRTETMFQQQQVSAANRRLALQMENRMAVQTAAIPKQSLKQRLGQPNIQGRLGTPLGQRGQGRLRGVRGGRVRGTVFTRGGRGIARGPGLRVNTGARGRGRGGMRGGLRGGLRGGQRGRGVMRGQGVGRGQGFQRGARGAIRGFRGRGGRGGQQQMTGFKVRGARGQMRGRGRGRGGRGGRGRGRGAAAQVQVNKEDLDNQLDAYMSNTKSGLDAELDAYMAEADME